MRERAKEVTTSTEFNALKPPASYPERPFTVFRPKGPQNGLDKPLARAENSAHRLAPGGIAQEDFFDGMNGIGADQQDFYQP